MFEEVRSQSCRYIRPKLLETYFFFKEINKTFGTFLERQKVEIKF